MTKFLCMVFTLLLPLASDAVTLDGTWQSDKEKTLKWNEAHLKIDPDYLRKLSYILGHTYITFGAGRICVYVDSYEINGIKREPLSPLESSYQVVTENAHGVVIRESFPGDTEKVSMLVFESEDSFYGVALDTEDYGKPGYREYFKKAPLQSRAAACS